MNFTIKIQKKEVEALLNAEYEMLKNDKNNKYKENKQFSIKIKLEEKENSLLVAMNQHIYLKKCCG